MRDKGAKRAANRKLHIDDGCMGGGGSIGFHKNYLFWDEKPDDEKSGLSGCGPYNDFTDVMNNYFDRTNNVFHYVVSGCYYSKQYNAAGNIVSTWNGSLKELPGDSGASGMGIQGGGNFFIGAKQIQEDDNTDYRYARVFMHELGHALGLHAHDEAIMLGSWYDGLNYGSNWGKLQLDEYIG